MLFEGDLPPSYEVHELDEIGTTKTEWKNGPNVHHFIHAVKFRVYVRTVTIRFSNTRMGATR